MKGTQSISSATITTSADDSVTGWMEAAAEHTHQASRLLRDEKYNEALEHYQTALHFYEEYRTYPTIPPQTPSWIRLCHTAGCLRNMGAIHRISRRYPQAIDCWKQAEVLYQQCQRQSTNQSAYTTSMSSQSLSNPFYSQGSLSGEKPLLERWCFDALWMETLQVRCTVQLQIKESSQLYHGALQSLEELLHRLVQLARHRPWEQSFPAPVFQIVLEPLSLSTYLSLMHTTTDTLLRSASSGPPALRTLLERSLQILHSHVPRKSSLSSLRHSLSTWYLDAGQLDKAVAILEPALAIVEKDDDDDDEDDGNDKQQNSNSKDKVSDVILEAMDHLGSLYEQDLLLDKALQCYEKTLLARSHMYGDHHLEVAKSLIQVGRVMELQGNQEGSLDLYRAAQAIYAEQLTSKSFVVALDDVNSVLQLVPTLLEQGRCKEALAYLSKCMEVAEDGSLLQNADSLRTIDKSMLYYNMGRAYLGIRDFVSATVCLVEAAKQDGEASEELIFALLQRVEFLQREGLITESDVSVETSSDSDSSISRPEGRDASSEHENFADLWGMDDELNDALEDKQHSNRSISSRPGPFRSVHQKPNKFQTRDKSPAPRWQKESTTVRKEIPAIQTSWRDKSPIHRLRERSPSLRQQTRDSSPAHSLRGKPVIPPLRDVSPTVRLRSSSPAVSIRDTAKSLTRSKTLSPARRTRTPSPAVRTPSPVVGSSSPAVRSSYPVVRSSSPVVRSASPALRASSPALLSSNPVIRSPSPLIRSPTPERKTSGGSRSASLHDSVTPGATESDPDGEVLQVIDHVNGGTQKSKSDADTSDKSPTIFTFDTKTLILNGVEDEDDEAAPGASNVELKYSMLSRIQNLMTDKSSHSGSLTEEFASSVPSPPPTESPLPPEGQDSLEDYHASHPKVAAKLQKSRMPRSRSTRGLRLNLTSPRRGKSVASSMDTVNPKSPRSRSGGFRLRRRDGFATLPEEKEAMIPLPEQTLDLAIEEQYHTSFDMPYNAPVQYIDLPSTSWDDGVSQITLLFDDSNKSRGRDQDWWWGVTAEGFGRWFPTSYVSQAVEAAEGFLSAKSIHARVKSAPLDMEVADNVDDNVSANRSLLAFDNPPNFSNPDIQIRREGSESLGPDVAADFLSTDVVNTISSRSPRSITSSKMEVIAELYSLQNELEAMDTSDARYGVCLLQLAFVQKKLRKLDDAIESASEALVSLLVIGNRNETIKALGLLGELCLHQSKYELALSHYYEKLKVEKAVHGYYSEDAAKTLNCIGTVHAMQNEFSLAMKSHREALHILKECHGEGIKDPLVSQTLCQIGSVYYRERNSLSTIKSKKDDYSTFIEAGMLEVIGRAHEDRGSYKMAIAFFEEKLQFVENRKNEQKEQKEELATTLNSLGMLSSRAGLYPEALEYYEKAAEIQKELGHDKVHAATANVLKAIVVYQLGQWDMSLKILKESLALLHAELGKEHETVAATWYQIGVVQVAQCEFDAATIALNKAYDIQNKLLGKKHPATLRTLRELGNIYTMFTGEIDKAFQHFDAVLSVQVEVHGDRHPNIAETLHSIGCAYARKGEYSKALHNLEDCYYMRLEFLGVDHPLQATTLHEIAKIHLKRGRTAKALQLCDIVLSIRHESLGEQHVDIARAMGTKGNVFTMLGQVNEAQDCFNKALLMAETTAGTNHPAVAELAIDFGTLHLRMCHFDDARKSIQRGLDIYRDADFEDDYPGIKDAVANLDRVHRDELLCV
jgi:tetratricopeptide (TPR) repeat protein